MYRSGRRAAGRHVVLFAFERADAPDHPRTGVTASKKVGSAVRRSRCKRRLRVLLRSAAAELGEKRVDLVANARASCADAAWMDLVTDFAGCFERLKRAVS